MKEDEYIDLDKINADPSNGARPGFSKEEQKKADEKAKLRKAKAKKKTAKTAKKTANVSAEKTKTAKRKHNKSNNKIIYLLLGLIGVAIIILAIILLIKPDKLIDEDKVLLLINDKPVSEQEIKTRQEWFSLVNGLPLSDDHVLEATIDIEVLYQEAKAQELVLKENEIEDLFMEMAMYAQITQEEFKQQLEEFGINYALLKKITEKEFLARKLIEQEAQKINITEEELLSFYEANQQYFYDDEQNILSYEDVKKTVEEILKNQKLEEIYLELVYELRKDANIQYYTEINKETENMELIVQNVTEIEQITEEMLNELMELEEQETTNETDVVEETEIEEIIEEPINLEEEAEDDVEESADTEEEQEVIETETTEPMKPLTETENLDVLKLAKCLTEKGAKMYNVYWSPHGQQQAELFGEHFKHVKSIECDPDGVNPKIEECKETLTKEYPTWPTWKIGEELHEGNQNLLKLANLAGCDY